MKQLVLLASLALAAPAGVLAQTPSGGVSTESRPAAYATEYDSLTQRAARVRARTEARIAQFRTAFGAIGGTRRKVVSYGRLKVKNGLPSTSALTCVKKEITKHKTHGAEVSKICYYGLKNRLLLAEYYQQNQLVRLELHEYPTRSEGEYGTVFREAWWVRGDYLRLQTHAQENQGTIHRYYFTSLRQPS